MELVEELRDNLKKTSHLSSDEQLRLLDEQLSMAEQLITGNENSRSADLSEHKVMEMLAGATSHYGKASAKQMFAGMFNKQIETSKQWVDYFSLLQEKFSSSRISSLAKRQTANHQHLVSLLKKIENY